ncbi:hypothetical protein HRbin08_02243 [bacterium HR08]|nr:hypothetical protein HRbin08_02243 [bacterium HR08]
MGCDHFTFADWLLGFLLAVMMTFVGGMGLWQPVRLWYWLEWLACKQDQWWLGYRADQLEDPGERVHRALATYPQAIRIIQFVSGCMLLVSIPALAVFLYLLIQLRACL